MSRADLEARDYDGIPLEVCQAVYDTITKNKYERCAILSEDVNLIDWIRLANPKLVVYVMPGLRMNFAFVGPEFETQALELTKRIKREGQIGFYGLRPEPLRAFFNKDYDNWMTIELPIGDGIFVARRL